MADPQSDEPNASARAVIVAPNGSRRRGQWAAPAQADSGTAADSERAAPPGRRSRLRGVLPALTAVVILAIVGVMFMAEDGGGSRPAAQPAAANNQLVPLGMPIPSGSLSTGALVPAQPPPSPSASSGSPSASASAPPAGQQDAARPSKAPAASAPAAPYTFHLIGGQSNLCLDIPGGSTSGGTQAQLHACNGTAAQTFTLNPNGQISVYGGSDRMCLDPAFGATETQGAFVIIWSCGAAQDFWTLNANGTVTLVQSGLCLDVTDNGTTDGSPVEIWDCDGGANQNWHRY